MRAHERFAALIAYATGGEAAEQPQGPALQREVAALVRPPTPAPQPAAPSPPEEHEALMMEIRCSAQSLVQHMWDAASTEQADETRYDIQDVSLDSLPFTWYKPGVRRCSDGAINVLPNTFLRLPSNWHHHRFLQRRCAAGKRGSRPRKLCTKRHRVWMEANSPGATRVLVRCTSEELFALQSEQVCVVCSTKHSVDDMRLCTCGVFVCDEPCYRLSACPHDEEFNVTQLVSKCSGLFEDSRPDGTDACPCKCCKRRHYTRSVDVRTHDTIEMRVQGKRWTITFTRNRFSVWYEDIPDKGSGPPSSSWPVAVKLAMKVLLPVFTHVGCDVRIELEHVCVFMCSRVQ